MRAFYDELAEGEWRRLVATPHARVSYEVHRRFLDPFVRPRDRVLEIGAGPGRFTIELATRGAVVEVTDFSPVQLDLHRHHVGASEAESAVASRSLLDVCDTSRYQDATFDVVLAYGGPLSYAFEGIDDAMAGLFRIVKPGGYVVASVMSALGSWRYFLREVVEESRVAGEDANDLVLTTGDLRHLPSAHVCQMFRAREVDELVTRHGGEMVARSASNWASLEDPDVIEELEGDPDRWARFIEHEVAACAEPGALDGGTHLLFAARRP